MASYPTSYSVQLPITILDHKATVHALIDTTAGDWNINLIHQIFNSREAEAIWRLPISRANADDQMKWRPAPSGQFSVKSVYHTKLSRLKNKEGDSILEKFVEA